MSQKGIKFLLSFLATLLAGQIAWWGYLIIEKQLEITTLLGTKESLSQFESTRFMILSEGLVFTVIWVFGVVLAYRFYRKETQLRNAHRDFLSAVTHELKTPIANVQLSLESTEREGLSEDQITKYINRAKQALSSLNTQIDSVLASTNENYRPSKLSDVDLKLLVNEILNEFPNDSDKFEVAIPEGIKVRSNPSELPIVVRHIIDNAVKYSVNSSDQPIKIQSNQVNKTIELSISDRGQGLEPRELESVFTPYWRSKESQNSKVKGTGLGLMLTQSLCERMGIGLKLESPGKDQGTTVTLAFVGDIKNG